ncbi:DUF839 domain-containing protein [Leptothoe sp. LEGE 181152]|nr:DUF839 domain-containing protein [Leptothoe sp. LEGE 181152]
MGFAGNKYGWMVEVDPANPNDYGTKHTWLERYRHEAVSFHAVAGISTGTITDPKDNSNLLIDSMLYGAKFNAVWLPWR